VFTVLWVPSGPAAPWQGDVRFAEVLEQMGAEVRWEENAVTVAGTGRLRGVDVNMNTMPDVAMTLAVVALFADGPTAIRDGETLVPSLSLRCERHKPLLAVYTAVQYTRRSLCLMLEVSGGLAVWCFAVLALGCSWELESEGDGAHDCHLHGAYKGDHPTPPPHPFPPLAAANAGPLSHSMPSWQGPTEDSFLPSWLWLLPLAAGRPSGRGEDYCIITPPQRITPAEIDTYDDHRMAMAFSLAACGGVPIVIPGPRVHPEDVPRIL